MDFKDPVVSMHVYQVIELHRFFVFTWTGAVVSEGFSYTLKTLKKLTFSVEQSRGVDDDH